MINGKSAKRWLSLLLALVLAIAVTACGGGGGTEGSKPTETGGGTSGAEATTVPDTSEFVVITNHVLGDPPTNNSMELMLNELNPYLKEKINANVKWEWIEWADYLTKYNLLLASGQNIDLIHASSTWLDFWPNVQRGAFLELDDLLPKYAPLTWKEIPEEDWEQCRDPKTNKIYCFPENDYTQYVNHGMFYRGDWLKEFGMEPIKNFEQLSAYLKKVKDTKGPQGVIPFDATPDMSLYSGYVISNTDYVNTNINTGRHALLWGKSFETPYELVCPVFDDLFVEYAKLMKDWDRYGIWRKDVLNYKGNTRDSLKAGKSACDQHHTNTYRYLRYDMDRLIPGSDLQMFAWCDTRNNLVAEPITHGATAIGKTSQNPERATMLYELFRQDEKVYRLINWGVEGVHYVIKDGKLDYPEGFNPDKDGFYSDWWGGRTDKFELPQAWEWEGIRDLWKHLDSIVKKPFPYSRFVLDRTPIEAELSAISQVTTQMGQLIDFGKVDDPVKAVEEYRAQLKAAGIDKVIEEVNRQLAEYAKLISK